MIDVLHMLPSDQGHVAILVAVDVFSRFCVLVPMYSVDSEETTELVKLHVVGGPGGIPDWIVTDNGPEFRGEFSQWCSHESIVKYVHKLISANEMSLPAWDSCHVRHTASLICRMLHVVTIIAITLNRPSLLALTLARSEPPLWPTTY